MRSPKVRGSLNLNQSLLVGILCLIFYLLGKNNGGGSKEPMSRTTTCEPANVVSSQPLKKTESSMTRKCSAEMADKQGDFVLAAKVRGCPPEDDVWLRFVHSLMPHAKVFVDIGSNKGYTAARLFELWSPELGLNAPILHRAHRAVSTRTSLVECGACRDCLDAGTSLVPLLPRSCGRNAESSGDPKKARAMGEAVTALCEKRAKSFEPIRVFSFDGNPDMINGSTFARDYILAADANISRLASLQDIPENRLPSSPRQRFLKEHWSLELAAFSDSYAPGRRMQFLLGFGERGHVVTGGSADGNDKPSGNIAIVPVLTVDYLMERESLQHIDILKIDTEGHDPSVLRGAQKAIASHSVTLVIFEYNTMWDVSEKLGAVVAEVFEKNDYACYMEGKNLLLKLTQGCWSDKLEIRTWSNVWCASLKSGSGIAISSVFDAYSMAFM